MDSATTPPARQRAGAVRQDVRQVAAASADAPGLVHLVWTRPIDGQKMVGRLQVAAAVRTALGSRFTLRESILRPITAGRSPRRLLAAALVFLGEAVRGRLLPLQCLLFADPVEARRVIGEIAASTCAVYLDGVRCVVLLDRLRRARPDLAIVTDLDDLMSRRMALLLALNQPPSAGYMKGAMPGFVDRLLRWPPLGRALLRYERRTLARIEPRLVAASDRTVLVSREDARILADRAASDSVVGIAMPASVARDPRPLLPGPLRFVFVGTDALRQNQLTIDALLALWAAERIATPLVIYGEQLRGLALPAGVTMPGYAETIGEIYDGRSILLSPSYLAGGLKTKVLEAFAYGAPVAGNRITFEGMDIGNYPLLIDEPAAMLALLHDPDASRATFDKAARHGAAMVREKHDPEAFARRWTALVADAIAGRAAQRP